MSLRPTPHRRLSGPVAGLLAVLLAAGCGAGNRAQTYQQQTEADTTNDAVGAIAVRNLAIPAPPQGFVYKAGSDAPLQVILVNDGGEADRLVSASTPAARSVQVVGPTPTLEVPRLATSDPAYQLQLRGLTRDLAVGSWIELTLNFERNGSKTLLAPVHTVPTRVAKPEGHYKIVETDSEGRPLSEDGTAAPAGEGGVSEEHNTSGDNVQENSPSEHR